MFACMTGIPPQAADSRAKEDKMDAAYKALRGIYSDDLISLVRWCMKMTPESRPQSVHQLQKALKPSETSAAPQPEVKDELFSKFMFFLRGGKRAKGIAAIRATHEAAHRERIRRNKLKEGKNRLPSVFSAETHLNSTPITKSS
jgi:hypothetical protein